MGHFFNAVVPVYSSSSTAVYSTYEYVPGMLSLIIRTASAAKQSTARHSVITPAQIAANRVRARAHQGTYQNKYFVCTYTKCCVRFVFLEHGALGICKSHVCTYIKCGTIHLPHLPICHGPLHSYL